MVNHKDGNPANNCAENLEWVTAQGNSDHAVATGLTAKGERQHLAKLTATEVAAIRVLHAHMPPRSIAKIARMFGVSRPTVRNIVHRHTWTHI